MTTGAKWAQFLLCLVLIATLMIGCAKETEPKLDGSKVRKLANNLYEWKLYQQAIKEYEHYLNQYVQDEQELANINYIIANIYFERLHDYENALGHYLKIKYYSPENRLVEDVNKKVIACLERLDRSTDAHQALEETTSLEPEKVVKKRPGAVIAKIGKREITQGDLDFELSQLPTYLQSQFSDKKKKREFLEQYIATELFYDTAKRQTLDENPDVIEGAFQAKKRIMVQKLLQQQIEQKVNIQPEDIELYFKANSDKYAEKDKEGNIVKEKSLQEVQQQVAQDLFAERQRQVYNDLLQRLMRAESVEIFEDKIK
ncbi:hypothetical protein JXJ21_17970 [candidate division KSB1 bacterium]|nr:hypothetical protein [candidate division KSB1 bacterium]